MSNKDLGQTVTDGKQAIVSYIKNKVFDIIGIAILVAMFALMLDIVEGRPFTLESLKEVVVQVIPFYICAMLLSLNYYKKGSYGGKNTQSFIETVTKYSEAVDSLSGMHIRHLNDFCKEYNEQELKNLQTAILSREGIEYSLFEKEYIKLSNKELKAKIGKTGAKLVRKAKKAKVVGVNPNILLGNRKCADSTDLGPTEVQLARLRGAGYVFSYLATIAFLTFLIVKNILEWNWLSLIYELAKVIYIFVRSYMRYFEGYEDITVKLQNSINRNRIVTSILYIEYNINDGCKTGDARTSPTNVAEVL